MPSNAEIVEKVKNIVAEQLNVAPEDIKPESTFVGDLGADSLDLTELVMAMEEAFGIEIADEDTQKLSRVQDVVEYVEKHVK